MASNLRPVSHVLCALAGFLAAQGKPRTPQDLQDQPGLCYANLGPADSWRYRASDGTTGTVLVQARPRSFNGDALREAAIAGEGFVCETSFIMHCAMSAHQTVTGPDRTAATDLGQLMACRRDRRFAI